MTSTCIVCGQAAGSGEHVFPASLGGRRTNKNIYCTTHDNGYSSLVNVLASQIDIFNSHLGVVNDHTKAVKSIAAQDPLTGQKLSLSAKESRFTEHRIIATQSLGRGEKVDMSFPDQKSLNAWLAEQKTLGNEVTILKKGEATPYLLDTIQQQRVIGGRTGLGAVAYIAQTFLAQSFPELARSDALADFISYTQAVAKVAKLDKNSDAKLNDKDSSLKDANDELELVLSRLGGEAPVWWDFEPQPNQTQNTYNFGHRITLGTSSLNNQIFGRISLFSSLHFSIHFGTAKTPVTSKTVTIDIDPLAKSAPNDCMKTESDLDAARVVRPSSLTAGLAAAISSHAQNEVFADLMRRMADYTLTILAQKIHSDVLMLANQGIVEREEFIRKTVNEQSQRVWNLVKVTIKELVIHLEREGIDSLTSTLERLIERDQASHNGLSFAANEMLESAKIALTTQMIQDLSLGKLDERRIAQLLGEGPGAEVIGRFILKPILDMQDV